MEPEGSLQHSHVPATCQSLTIPFFILGIKQGLGIVTWNTEDLVVIVLVCVFLEVFLTALYFRVTYCPHVQSLCSIRASALCSWLPFGVTWEHKALGWGGTSC